MRTARFLPALPLLVAGLGLGLATLPAAAATGDEEAAAAAAYARDNTVFTLYHEFGHLFVDQFDLPVLAREEDAVDNLATLMALDDWDRSQGGGVLGNAVYGWELIVGEDGDGAPDTATLYDSHSLNAQRAFTMVCLLAGRDKAVFGAAASDWGMDDERQDDCAGDYAQAKASWDRVLAEHRVETAGAGADIQVVYDHVTTDESAAARDILQSEKVLERFAETMQAAFKLPEGIVLRASECEEDNAYYSADDTTITVCYELVTYYVGQYVNAPAAGGGGAEVSEASGDPPINGRSAQYYREPLVNERRIADK